MHKWWPSILMRRLNFGAPVICFLLWASQAFAADYYVAPAGLDTNPGSQAQPWKTIQKAADTLAAGDTVYVHAGRYSPVMVNVSGSAAGGFVTFCNYPGEKPVIDATGIEPPKDDDAGLFLLVDRSYVIISGFELRNYQTTSPKPVPAGIFLRGACQHVRILKCVIHDISNTGGKRKRAGNAFGLAVYGSSTTPATDIVIDGNELYHMHTGQSETLTINGNVTNFRVSHNRLHDNNNIGIVFIGFEETCPGAAQDQARDGICCDNIVWNISSQNNQGYKDGDYSADGLYCDGATRVTLERNVVHDCDIGVELSSEHSGRLTSGILLRDNFFYSNRQGGILVGGYAKSGTGGTAGCMVTGNTCYNDDTMAQDNGEVQIRFRTSHCVFRDNIFCGGPDTLLVTVPVAAEDNVGNAFDYNLYYSPAGDDPATWIWNKARLHGFAAWKSGSGQDAHSLFADPKFIRTSGAPDLHLQPGSPARQAGDPAFVAAKDETDIDGDPRMAHGRIDLGADQAK
jgi:hypothetical protein